MRRKSTAEGKVFFSSAKGRDEAFLPRPEASYPQWLFGPCQSRGF